MSKMFRLLILVLLAGGWTLAAAALHVVRTPGRSAVPYLPESWGRLTLITKDRLGFKDTYSDVRYWTTADLAAHPALAARLTALGKGDLLKHVTDPPPAPARPERDDRDGEPGPIVAR